MQRKNIPNYVLAKGISRVGFEQLLQDIRNAVIEEGLNEFCNYSELLNFIKEKDGANSEQWISEFEMQLNESTNIINENMAKIENLFARIFADWEVYKQEHDIVEEVEEEKVETEVPVEENSTTEDAAPVEVQLDVPTEEVKVELEPVVSEETSAPEVTNEVPIEEAKEEPKEEVVVPTVEEKTEEPVVAEEEKPKKEKKSKKDKSETEGDNNG